MTIWVDADACPVPVKEMLFRAAKRTHMRLVLVANQPMQVPKFHCIETMQVSGGFDVADNEIVRRLAAGDLVVTADIPLAAEVVDKGAVALNPRGELYTKENIKARLSMRDLMETLRSSGVHTGGSAPFDNTDRQRFANALDKWLAKQKV